MTPKRELRMPRLASRAAALLAAAVLAGGCNMDIQNPNAPDAPRAFKDPAGLAQLLGGAFRTWVNTRENYLIMSLPVMADNYTASWNNAAIRFYSSIGADCPDRCGWTNSAAATETAGGPEVESSWYGYYTVLSAGNDVLKAISLGTCFDLDCSKDNTLTSRNTAIAKMLQGMAFAGIALLYDQGFALDESVNLATTPIASIPFSTRQEMRDSALSKFEQAYAEAGKKTWSTQAGWMGVGQGKIYSNTQIQQLIRTMEAELIAMWPRNSAENTAADWAKVAQYASQGVSSGAPFTFEFYIDNTARDDGIDYIKQWGNDVTTERVHTRVAHMLDTSQADPWPAPLGNPCPYSGVSIWGVMDKRVGDGTWGPGGLGYGESPATANAGTDYACSTRAIFRPERGQYHQSNMTHIRYSYLSYYDGLPGEDGTGQDPLYTTQMNNLLWAEGLIRSSGSLVQAAQLIDSSRVGRGGLPALTGAEPVDTLLKALQYEQEIEFMGQGVDPFFIKRRTGTPATAYCVTDDGLCKGTPRHMPVPAKELLILVKEIYSFGGPSLPSMVAGKGGEGGSGTTSSSGVRSVREIWEQLRAMARAAAGKRF